MAVNRQSEFLNYLAQAGLPAGERLPPLPEMARKLGVSVGKLREQLEVARALGLVEVRPKTGIRALPFSAFPGLWVSLRYALSSDPAAFEQFEALRHHVEASFFHEAVLLLQPIDLRHLERLVSKAWERLRGEPIQIPHAEHRELHLAIYSRLNNPFVHGILEAYWEAYETAGLNVYSDYAYLHEVWTYHERVVTGIANGNYDNAYSALVEHTGLVRNRPRLATAHEAALEAPVAVEAGVRRRVS
ncbi:MAG TPA: FCD domain-containing protein [Anaerolineales bacterium]|nr:FCD domain-containing protein [Anaerolineales bacterium]